MIREMSTETPICVKMNIMPPLIRYLKLMYFPNGYSVNNTRLSPSSLNVLSLGPEMCHLFLLQRAR